MSNLIKFRMVIDECGEIIFSFTKLMIVSSLLIKSLVLLIESRELLVALILLI